MPPHVFPISHELREGVTGHRNLHDPDGVRRAVDALLDHIETTHRSAAESPRGAAGSPHSFWQRADGLLCDLAKVVWRNLPASPHSVPAEHQAALEWRVISALAKGADQLVAAAVLRRSSSQLTAITPFAGDGYERDFSDAADLARFRELWGKATDRRELDGKYGEFHESDSDAERRRKLDLRNEGYFRAGRETVDACEVLIAIWNGEPAAGKGGTGDVVAYAAERGRAVLWIDANNPAPAVQLILRKTSEAMPAGPLPGTIVQTSPFRAKQLSPTFHQLAAYNRDGAYDPKCYGELCDDYESSLRQAALKANLPEQLLDPLLKGVLPYLAYADQLAIRYQQLYVLAAVGLYSLSVAAVTIAVIQVLFFPNQLWLIDLEVLAMMAAVALLRIGRSESWHEKWLNDRHLAEQLRAALFTSLLDSNRPTVEQNDASPGLPFYHAPETWVNVAVRRIVHGVRSPVPLDPHFLAIKRFVIDGWLNQQADWHAKNAVKKESAARLSHRTGLVLFLATLIAACLHWRGTGHADGANAGSAGFLLGQAVTAVAIICPAWGAAIHAINGLRERERLAKRSQQMARILHDSSRNAERSSKLDEFRREVDATRQMAATENLEWWISLSFRELVLPA